MANFATHVSVAGMFAAGLAGATLATGRLDGWEALGLMMFLVAGTLLPDIDVDGGRPQRALFGVLSLIAATAVIAVLPATYDHKITWLPQLEPVGCEVFALALLAWFVVRYPLAMIFQRLTRHRGLCHSLVVGLCWSLGWVYVGLQCLTTDVLVIWLQGVAIFLGFVIHLVLDELFSVDFNNARVRRSFGSALKILQPDFPIGSLAACLLLALLIWRLPYPEEMLRWFAGI